MASQSLGTGGGEGLWFVSFSMNGLTPRGVSSGDGRKRDLENHCFRSTVL